MRMRIRVMTIADYGRVYALWMTCRNMGFNNLDDSREGIEKYLKRNPDTCFVALEGDALAGVILCGHDGRRGFIHHMAVAEGYRDNGIGTALVDAALSALRAEGIHKVALVAFKTTRQGTHFGKRWGSQCGRI
jgi:ribosomal protein S18 acetylase RimI-like enzyme